MHTIITRAAATAAGLGAALALAGCGAILEEAVEQAVESESGENVEIDFDSDDGSLSIQGEDGEEFSIDIDEDGESSVMRSTDDEGNTFEMVTGQGVPDEWPGDFPLPGGDPLTSSRLTENDRTTLSVTYELDDAASVADDLVSEYGDRGFTTESTSSFESDGSSQSFTTMSNGEWNVQITGLTDGSSGQLMITASQVE